MIPTSKRFVCVRNGKTANIELDQICMFAFIKNYILAVDHAQPNYLIFRFFTHPTHLDVGLFDICAEHSSFSSFSALTPLFRISPPETSQTHQMARRVIAREIVLTQATQK